MKKPLTNKKGEVRELTKKDFKRMRSAKEVLPEALLHVLPKRKRGERGRQIEPIKISITVRYSSEVVEYFRATGQGWQARMNKVLQNYVRRHLFHKTHD